MMLSDTTTKVTTVDVVNDTNMCTTSKVYGAEKEGGHRIVTPTTTATDIYSSNISNGFMKTNDDESETVTNSSSGNDNDNDNGNGVQLFPTVASSLPKEEAPSSPAGRSLIFRLLRFLLLNGPLMVCWAMLLLSLLVQEVWNGPLEKLLQSFAQEEESTELSTNKLLDHELTYYHRRCDHRDISTHDANDLLIDPKMTLKERQEIIMTHGAVVMKDILSHSTSRELREYLEIRHHEFHSNNLKLPWDELFWDGDGGQRLSLGLGPEDASIVSRAIAEVGSNSQLKKTLEATLGKDPAVVEVSTLSTMHDAEPQGIHTDSDYFASSVLYTRSFLHSYTMFISLQDTTSRMGATTICPGSHWCADEDLSALCQCNYMDDDEDEFNHIGYCNTFEASSNGQTGLDSGVLQRGDAMMFNQNIWHRGPRNYDENRKENRAMFILTFVSRRDYEKGDNRQQGWGTYYYMRHSMWGHLFSDLKTAATGGMDLFKRRIWKAYGLIGSSKTGNLPWLEHWARQMSNNMDFFMPSEVEEFQIMIRELITKNRLANWFFLDDTALENLFGGSYWDEDDYISWKDYLTLLVNSALHQSKQLYFMMATATVLANGVGYTLYCVFWYTSRWIRQRRNKSPSSSFDPPEPKPIKDASRIFGSIVVGHLLVLGIAAATRHYVLYKAPLFKRIHTGDINFKAFTPLPFQSFVDYEYNEEGDQIGSEIFYEELHPVDLLGMKQDREQQEFRMKNPKHPYSYYFEKELDRLEAARRTSDYLIPATNVPDVPKLPIQESAYPERNDVLIGSRFDADFLASMNFVLDFHPGNKEWIKLMKEFQNTVSANADEVYLNMAVDMIVSKILDKNDGYTPALLSNAGGTPRRFLKQDYETGWWIIMTQTEAKIITRRALLALAHPKSVGVLYEHWKQVLAESRFGKRRHTALAKKWTPWHLERMIKELFAEKSASEEHKTIVSPMVAAATGESVLVNGRRMSFLPSTGRGILPKSMVTGQTGLSVSNFALTIPTVLDFRVHLRKLMRGVVTLKIGDHVMWKGDDNTVLIFQATIIYIDADEDMVEIQPLRFDDVDDNFYDVTMLQKVHALQFYRPVQEGDIVWSYTRDPDDEDTSWKEYEVLVIPPFGNIELMMESSYAKRFQDFENKAIARDFKDIIPVEQAVPHIRLRQY